MPERLLILNPGSTSTKAAVYDGTRPLFSRSIPHSNQDLAPFPTLNDQLDYRVALVRGLAGPGAGGPVHPHRRGGPGRHPAQHRGRGLPGGRRPGGLPAPLPGVRPRLQPGQA